MRRLFLFRHAQAVHSGQYRDHERPLTAAGRDAAERIGAALATRGETIDLVLVSDSRRTCETLGLALAAYGGKPEVRIDPKLYHAERRDLKSMLRDLPNALASVMIVGHNPAIAEFAIQFTGSGDHDALARMAFGYPPGGLAIFDVEADWRDLRWGDGALNTFFT